MRQLSPSSLPEALSGQRHGLWPLPFAAISRLALVAVLAATPLAAQAEIVLPADGALSYDLAPMPAPGAGAELDGEQRQPSGAPELTFLGDLKTEGPLPAAIDPAPVQQVAPQPVVPTSYSGSMEPCLMGHGQRDLYREGLLATGWVDISDAGRAVAIAMLADAFLPITGAMDGAWEDHLAYRPASHQFWADMAQNRSLMEREGRILLLAGFLDDNGEMRVECWSAGPETTATDSFFLLAGQVWQSEGVMMTQLDIPATPYSPQSEILVSRIIPPGPMQPPLAASDGLRTTTIFPMQGSQL